MGSTGAGGGGGVRLGRASGKAGPSPGPPGRNPGEELGHPRRPVGSAPSPAARGSLLPPRRLGPGAAAPGLR